MSYRIIIEKHILKEIKALPKTDALRVSQAINNLSGNPRPRGCLKLEGEPDFYRIRIGMYRVIYSIKDNELIVYVIKVANRKDVYR